MQKHIINLYHTDCVYIRQKKWSLDLWYIEIALAVRPVDSFCMAAMCPDVQIKFLKYSNYLPCLYYVFLNQKLAYKRPRNRGKNWYAWATGFKWRFQGNSQIRRDSIYIMVWIKETPVSATGTRQPGESYFFFQSIDLYMSIGTSRQVEGCRLCLFDKYNHIDWASKHGWMHTLT